MAPGEPRALLVQAFETAVSAAHPSQCLPQRLAALERRPTVLLAAGKAAASMADAWIRAQGTPVRGLVVTPRGHGLPPGHLALGVPVVEAGHPLPDEAGLEAGQRLLALARGARPEERLVCLLSGGASALLTVPVTGVELADLQALTRELLGRGASIHEINSVRRKLSRLAGGRLAVATPAGEILLFVISDVPGDALEDIGSGPLTPDSTSLADARAVLARYACDPPRSIRRALADPANQPPLAGDPAFARVRSRVLATGATSLAAAAAALARAGYAPLVLGDRLEGESRLLAGQHAQLVRDLAARGGRWALLSGGETTVRLAAAPGAGGRNTEYLLALALALAPGPGVFALAADTDGIDGNQLAAGAVLTPDSLDRARVLGLDPAACLEASDSGGFFRALGDALVTGPTRTNVNDFRLILPP